MKRFSKKHLFLSALSLALLPLAASAQLVTLTDYYQRFDRGLTLGTNAWTNAAGTMRWNPATTNLQFSDGANWRDVGRGSSSVTNFGWGLVGSGTTSPLSVDPTVFVNTNLGFGLIGRGLEGDPVRVDQDQVVFQHAEDRLPGAYLAWGTTNYESVYGPRTAWSAQAAIALQNAGLLPETVYPGQLIYADHATDGNRHVYVCANAFSPADFPPGDLSWLPAAVSPDPRWTVFVRQGPRGETGPTGNSTVGLNGLGNVWYGRWDDNTGYVYSTATPIVVSYGGRWYDCVASSTGYPPNQVGATNYWAVSVDKGTSGTIVGWTNLVFRGDWDPGVSDYAENDAVWFLGNLYAVGPTNQLPGTGDSPSYGAGQVGTPNAWWKPLVLRGERGIKGEDGYALYSVTAYTLLPGTNTLFAGAPTASRSMLRWVSESGGNTTLEWIEHPRSGTNIISATNGDLRVNGVSPVQVLADRLASGYRTIRPAVVAGTEVSVWPGSNFMWRLDTAADAVATWKIDVSGRATNEVGILGLETFRAESNSWTWMSGLTNAPPVVGQTNLFLLYLPVGGTNWTLY